jgi:hypothetical protein
MSLITTEEKIKLLKNLLFDPDDWISREILTLAYQASEEQKQRSEASLPKAISEDPLDPASQQ